MEQPIYTQKRTEMADLLNQRQALRTKAERLVEELNWRLNPAGGPESIDMDKVRQAIQELDDAWQQIHTISNQLQQFPPEFQQGRRV